MIADVLLLNMLLTEVQKLKVTNCQKDSFRDISICEHGAILKIESDGKESTSKVFSIDGLFIIREATIHAVGHLNKILDMLLKDGKKATEGIT